MKKIIALILICLTTAIAFAGCSTSASPTPTEQTRIDITPAPAPSDIKFSYTTRTDGETSVNVWKYAIENNEVKIYGYEDSIPVVKIPETIEGKKVTAIDSVGLCKKTRVYVDGLRYESIITEVEIPSSIKSIPTDLFSSAYSVKKVVFDPSMDLLVEEGMLFNKNRTILYYCIDKNIESVNIPSTVTTIGGGAFRNCQNLKSVVVPSTVKTIGEYAFYNCTELANVTLEEGIVEIANFVFARCKKIEEITIPESVVSLGLKLLSFTEEPAENFGPKIKLHKGSHADEFIRANASSFGMGIDITKCIVYID